MSLRRAFFAGLAQAQAPPPPPPFVIPDPAPLIWLDSAYGLSADFSFWQSRTGRYAAGQNDAARRFSAAIGSNWLATGKSTYMDVPSVDLSYTDGFTFMAAVNLNNDETYYEGLQVGSVEGNGLFYVYNSAFEFYIQDAENVNTGSNPTVFFNGREPHVIGGDFLVNRYPSTTAHADGYNTSTYNRYGRRGTRVPVRTWRVGGGVVGRIRHWLVFDFCLTDEQRLFWVNYLKGTY